MKILGKILAGILICLVLVLVVLRITGFAPNGRRPGLWLKGELVTTPPPGWSPVAQYRTDEVETRSWYLLPHSVTTNFVISDGQLYLTSIFRPGTYPQSKAWTTNIVRDPHVRLKFGNQLFDCTVSLVTDPAEKAPPADVYAKKYPELMTRIKSSGSELYLFHAVPQ